MSPTPPIVQMTNDVFCLFVFWGFQTKMTKHYSLLQKKNVNLSHKITCQQQKDSSTSALTTVQLDSFNTSIFFPFFIVEEIISQSQIKVNTAVRRAFLLYYKEKKPLCGQKIQDWSFFFFSSYETLLFKQPEWIVSVHLSPITFTWVWMSLAAENLAL